ncbi:MAG TPA: hypothetical protein DCX26_01030 [Pseudomonas sp.]|nr:hypothetical protein [Pseudomonas sp.]
MAEVDFDQIAIIRLSKDLDDGVHRFSRNHILQFQFELWQLLNIFVVSAQIGFSVQCTILLKKTGAEF